MKYLTQPVGVVAAVAVTAALTLPAFSAPAETIRHTFVYVADKSLASVHVAGTFNNWDKGANALRADADGKTWRVTLPIPYGRHQYKFVLNDETWVTDPKGKSENDGNGNVNSILLVLPADYTRPALPDDGVIATSALLHDTRIPYCNYDRGFLTLSLRVRPDDVRTVQVVVDNKPVPMRPAAHDDMYARYIARLPWNRKTNLAYTFELNDGKQVRRYGAGGLASGGKATPFVLNAKTFKPFVVPSWVEKTVFYQIFPDRFANGSKANDPANVQPWDAKPTFGSRTGGDLAGVQQHLDYLSGLGVSGVYFNPVFKSPSNHRYDAEDYKTIAPDFGTNAEFATVTKELNRRGIRTVMDFVFNHTATSFAPFADIRQKGKDSAYKNWYFIKSFPIQMGDKPSYIGWSGYAAMPKLNVNNPPTRDYLLGLVNYWDSSIPLSGMRLDVASEVDPRFWRALRQRAKKLDPDMWIVGEVWGDGSAWLGGDQWDSVMNYPFRDACIRFIADGSIKPSGFANRLMANYEGYAPQVSRNLMNLISSHDTPRFLTLCKGDASLQRLAATVQFTWPGAPSVYYGEEIGMEGGMDPDNRRGMRWDMATPNNPMLRFYKRLISTRNASPALQSGDPQVLLTDDANGTFAYARVYKNDAALVAINRSSQPQRMRLPLPEALRHGTLIEALSGRKIPLRPGQTHVVKTLLAHSSLILLPAK